MDVAFIASFILSFPAALLADLSHSSSRHAIDLAGILARSPAGQFDAWLNSGQSGSNAATGRTTAASDDTIIGNFNLSIIDAQRGWPLVTTIERQPGRLIIDLMAEPQARVGVPRDPDDPIQRQIEKALTLDDQHEALAAWNLQQSETRRQWWAWFPAFGAWWIMMFAVAGIAIQFLRFASLWLTGKRLQREHARRTEGKCLKCGYDMTGLEFNERCPECGARVW